MVESSKKGLQPKSKIVANIKEEAKMLTFCNIELEEEQGVLLNSMEM